MPAAADYYPLSLSLASAAFSSLRSIIVVELMGLDKLTTCFSQLIIIHGVAIMIGTPIAGECQCLPSPPPLFW